MSFLRSVDAATDDEWATALETPAHAGELDLERTADHIDHRPHRGGVFTEVRRTTCTRTCRACGGPVYRSDPCVSIRTAPWAHELTGGRWHVIEFCGPCGAHRTGADIAA